MSNKKNTGFRLLNFGLGYQTIDIFVFNYKDVCSVTIPVTVVIPISIFSLHGVEYMEEYVRKFILKDSLYKIQKGIVM
jgi:hypothetical protein